MPEIAATVVLYNPESNVVENINSFVDQVEKLYVVDNSKVLDNSILKKITSNNKIVYISNKSNLGIATALNIAANKAIKDGFEYLLTMDQDSKASEDMVQELKNSFQSFDNLGIAVAEHVNTDFPNIVDSYKQHDKEVLFTITSGNLLSLAAFKSVGGFMDKLFIDHVDHEYCLRLNKNKYKVVKTNRAILYHRLGNQSQKKIFNWIFYPSHHPPIRLFYRTRNRFYVDKLYKKIFPDYVKTDRRNFVRELIEIIAFEKNVYQKIKMIVLGFINYKKNYFGEYQGEIN
jgi:rhamnosyltransferase